MSNLDTSLQSSFELSKFLNTLESDSSAIVGIRRCNICAREVNSAAEHPDWQAYPVIGYCGAQNSDLYEG